MTTQAAVAGKSVLIARGTVSIALTKQHDPDDYYRTCSGFFVYDGFRSDVVAKAKPVAAGTVFKVNVDELGENLPHAEGDLIDAEIEAALRKEHLFDESAASAIVAEMTERQRKGEPGDLDNTGRPTRLYTPSCVVGVFWDDIGSEWFGLTWDRNTRTCDAGGRVLSPAN
jgi:hypothetical protein